MVAIDCGIKHNIIRLLVKVRINTEGVKKNPHLIKHFIQEIIFLWLSLCLLHKYRKRDQQFVACFLQPDLENL